MKAWLAEYRDQMQVLYRPSYSRELNPDERLNTDFKKALVSRVQTHTEDKFSEETKAHMNMLSQNPAQLRSCFDNPRVQYVA